MEQIREKEQPQPNSLLPLLTLSFLSYFDIYHMNLAVHISTLHREPNPQERGIQSAPESPALKLGHRSRERSTKWVHSCVVSGSIGVTQPRLEMDFGDRLRLRRSAPGPLPVSFSSVLKWRQNWVVSEHFF